MTDMRSETFPFGVVGTGVSTVVRQVPAGEPPALAPNAELAVIGKSVPRHDGRAKVTGAIKYTVDAVLPGMLHARILRSTMPHALVAAIDISAALRHPGVRTALVTVKPGDAAVGTVRYIGAPVAAIAATSIAAAEEALRLIRVDYRSLPFVADMDAAQAPGAAIVYGGPSAPAGHASGFPARANLPLNGNVRGPAIDMRGDVVQGFAASDVVVEGEYRTQVQTHCCLEPHAILADWRNDGLTVRMSTQYTAGVRQELAEAFGLPLSRVRVFVEGMGGGFGSKSGLGNYGRIAVMLSRQAQAPVRLFLDREEEQMDSGNRPGTFQHLRIGAKKNGTLTAITLESCGTAGVGLGAGVGNVAQSLYTCANFYSSQNDVFINAGPSTAMRAPGNTQGAYAMEQAIDELAERLGIDPLTLRDRIDPSAVRREERRIGGELIGWKRRRPPGSDAGPIKRGIGVAQSFWDSNVQTNSACEVRLARDGTVEVLSGVQDIGTGTSTVIAQTVAEVFGLQPEQITLRLGDTDYPAGPPSYGSRATASITPPARTAAFHVLEQLLREAAPALNAGIEQLVVRDGYILVGAAQERRLSFRDAAQLLRSERISATASRADDYTGFRRRMGDGAMAQQDLGGVQFAQVAVDTETGAIRVERVVAVQDCGRPINPKQIESQVHGGVLMGVSYALFENRILDRHTGRMVNPNLEQYKLIGACDIPDIETVILEEYRAESATDAYGVAEPSNIATAPAIANAVYNAIGVRLRSLPMTPAAVLAALGMIRGAA
jgi:xanthine dehydrogenase YagR molybdenum-binding subunit